MPRPCTRSVRNADLRSRFGLPAQIGAVDHEGASTGMFSLARLCNASKSATPSTARYGAYRESYGLPMAGYIAKRINFSIPAELQGAIELIRASGVPNDTAQ